MSRATLIVLSIVALLTTVVWWFMTGLLSSDREHSACHDAISADLAHIASYFWGLLAISALAAASTNETVVANRLLAAYGVLLGLAFLVFAACV